MAWIQSHPELMSHPKLFKLSSLSGLSVDLCIAKLHRLWWWTLHYAENGYLEKYEPNEILFAIGFDPPDSGQKFYNALLECKFIDAEENRIHDWWEYIGRFMQIKYKHKEMKWQEIKHLYENSSKNGSYNRSKNRASNRYRNHKEKNRIEKNINPPTPLKTTTDQETKNQVNDSPFLEKENGKNQDEKLPSLDDQTPIEKFITPAAKDTLEELIKKFPRFPTAKLISFAINQKKHPAAIEYALEQTLSKSDGRDPGKYFLNILERTSGNFYEQESMEQAAENKNIYSDLVNNLKKLQERSET